MYIEKRFLKLLVSQHEQRDRPQQRRPSEAEVEHGEVGEEEEEDGEGEDDAGLDQQALVLDDALQLEVLQGLGGAAAAQRTVSLRVYS